MNLTLLDNNFRDPNPWSINWYHVKDKHRKRRTPISQGSTTLRVPDPLLHQTGEQYEVDVRNQFGLARGVARILVTEGKLCYSPKK